MIDEGTASHHEYTWKTYTSIPELECAEKQTHLAEHRHVVWSDCWTMCTTAVSDHVYHG